MITVIASLFGAICITAIWGILLDLCEFGHKCFMLTLGILSSLLVIAIVVAAAIS